MVNENLYYLMHENDIVCLLFMDEVSGRIMKTGTKVNQELLPLGGNQSQQELKKWWDRRNEVIASAFHKKQNRMPYTEYQLCDISTKNETGLGCICKGFASIDKEFVSAYDVVCSRKKRNDIDYPNRGELIIKGCEQKVELLEKFQKGEKIYQKNFKKVKLL